MDHRGPFTSYYTQRPQKKPAPCSLASSLLEHIPHFTILTPPPSGRRTSLPPSQPRESPWTVQT